MTFWPRAVTLQRVMPPKYGDGKENLLFLKKKVYMFSCIKSGHITRKRLRRIHPKTTHSEQRDSHLSSSSRKHITVNTKVCIFFFLLVQHYTAKAYQFWGKWIHVPQHTFRFWYESSDIQATIQHKFLLIGIKNDEV